jgi:hypothetical protein
MLVINIGINKIYLIFKPGMSVDISHGMLSKSSIALSVRQFSWRRQVIRLHSHRNTVETFNAVEVFQIMSINK